MNKIDKLDKELEKAREKAAEWQAKIRELEKQKQEAENSQIVQAVRSLKLTPAQLMAFLNDPKNSLTAAGHTDPVSYTHLNGIQLRVLRETVNKRDGGVPEEQQPFAGIGMGHIGKLVAGEGMAAVYATMREANSNPEG